MLFRSSSVGAAISLDRIGEKVVALLTGGGYAQKVAVPVGQVMSVPPTIALSDAAALHARAVAAGYRARSTGAVEIPVGPNRGGRAAYLIDPDGYHIELFQRPPALCGLATLPKYATVPVGHSGCLSLICTS